MAQRALLSVYDKAGIKDHDIIVAVNGQGVRDAFDVTRLVAAKRPGQTVTLDVWRNKKRVQVKVTLLKRTLQ